MVSKNSAIDTIPVPVANGGTSLATLTAHAVYVGNATSAPTALSVGNTGTILAGSTGADPAFTATPSGLTSVTSGSFITSSATLGTTFSDNIIDASTGSNANIDLNITTKNTGSIIYAQSKPAVEQAVYITNSDNTAVASPATLQIAVGGPTNTSDPSTRYVVSTATTWSTGIDNSASDAYVIAASGTLGSSNAASWSTAGDLTNTGAITLSNGNLTLGTAGNKILSTSVASTTTAGANSFGTVTLSGGTATISTSAVTASSIIYLTRQSVGSTGAAALGELSVGTISANTSFVINAWSQADATALAATDVSVIGWMIVN